MRWRCLSCLMFLLSCSLPSTRTFAADKWIHATSAHFDMYAAESDADARAALQHLEAVRAFFVTATHSQDPGGQPVRVVVFHSEGEFEKYRPVEYAGASVFSTAGPPATIVAVGLKPEMYEKIFLEYCQLVLDASAPKVPYWLRAGLAQFYSTLKPGDNTIKLGGPPTRSFHGSGAGGLDMTLLTGIDKASYLASRSKAANDFYADTNNNAALGKGAKATTALNSVQSSTTQDYEGPIWTLTHMLMFNPDYRSKVSEFIGVLGSGQQDSGAAFNSVYGRSLAQVLNDLLLYMKQSSLAVANIKFAVEKPAAPQITPATKEDEDRIFADLGKKGK